MSSQEYPFHEIAEIFPLMEGQEFRDLKRDIEENGQQEPIWLYQGRIIDGRNRYRACRDLGRPVLTREWDGNGSLVAFVQSLNLKRRHLNESQRGIVALKIKSRFEAEARERMLAGKKVETAKNGEKTDPSANLREGKASEAAAREMGVSPRTVETASKVVRHGTPELIKAVEQGEVAVSAAVEVARLPKREQEKIVSKGPTAIVRHAAAARTERVEAKRRIVPEPDVLLEASQDEAAELGMKWAKAVSDIRFRLNSLTTEQVKALALIMHRPDRKTHLADLRRLAKVLASWIKILESNHADKIRTLD